MGFFLIILFFYVYILFIFIYLFFIYYCLYVSNYFKKNKIKYVYFLIW